MKSTGLDALLAVNGIDLEDCKQTLYQALRTQCFVQICDILRTNREEYTEALRLYRSSIASARFSEMMVTKYCSYRLDFDSYVALGQMFRAFFRKSEIRRVYPSIVRHQLLICQNHKCAICNKPIAIDAELDHIVPWLYVGDELDDNLQMLCRSCNRKKRASSFYPLHALLSKETESNTESVA